MPLASLRATFWLDGPPKAEILYQEHWYRTYFTGVLDFRHSVNVLLYKPLDLVIPLLFQYTPGIARIDCWSLHLQSLSDDLHPISQIISSSSMEG